MWADDDFIVGERTSVIAADVETVLVGVAGPDYGGYEVVCA